MSLNGLDDAAIKEAHEATVSEPGGWFLIKYASRDGVELHDRGTGGIVEFQNAIAQYEEASPLYGFLRYRRRNVIVKCLPDACSRLVQARVTVHFNAVCERFAPYNTTFSIADAKDLKDSKLSAACSLHTASSSTSSSTSSLRRRRLMEIAEEEEEELRATKRQLTAKDGDYPGTQNEPGSVTFAVSHSTLLPAALNSELAKSPNESHFAGTVEPPSFTGIDRPSSPAKSLESRSISPQLSHLEMSNYAAYAAGKPKVKLAPRPSVDVSGRPRTSAGTGTQRPVSAIPAGFRLQSKGSRKGRSDANVKSLENSVHQISEDDAANIDASSPTETDSIEALANISGTLDVVRPHTSSGRPTSSSGISVKSVATTATATAAKHTTMTPEKARLIKAMKLREKKKKMSTLPPLPIPSLDICEPVDEIVSPNTSQPEESHGSISATGTSFSGGFDDRPGSNSGRSANNDMPNSSFSDSAIDMGLSAIDQSSIITQTSDLHSPCARPASSGGSESAKTVSLPGTADKQVLPLQDTDLEKNLSEHNLPEDGNKILIGAAIIDANLPAIDTHCGAPLADVSGCSEGVTDTHLRSESLDVSLTSPEAGAGEPESEHEVFSTNPSVRPIIVAADAERAHTHLAQQSPEDPAAQMTDSSRPSTSTTSEFTADLEEETLTPLIVIPSIALPEPRGSQSTLGLETSDPASADVKRARRRALVNPIHTDLINNNDSDVAGSDANLSDDERLTDELQSVTVHEAKSMTVSKSPITPVFPKASPPKQEAAADGELNRSIRTVSGPTQSSLLNPGDAAASSARSASSGNAFLQKIAQQNSANLLPKKTNIGSTISQRIKALEKLSGNTPGATAEMPLRTERPTSTFFSVRKMSGRDTSRSPSVAERASSLTRDKTPSPPTSREESSPEMSKFMSRDRSVPLVSRLSVFEYGNPPRGRPESVQVRAKIIRDPLQPLSKMPGTHFDSSEPGQLQFKQSPLTIDHHRASQAPSSAHSTYSSSGDANTTTESAVRGESIQDRRKSKDKRRSQSHDRSTIADDSESTQPRRRSSLTIMKDFIKERRASGMTARSPSTDNLSVNNLASPVSLIFPAKLSSRPPSVHTTHGLTRRLSISSRHSTANDRDATTSPHTLTLSPSLLTETSGSGDEGKSSTAEFGHKKTGSGSKNRTSRFMRRLSSSLSAGRKAATPAISPTVTEEEEAFSTVLSSRGGPVAQRNTLSYLGDVNVQFPDNLLWKRRAMCLDSQGFLVLSTSNGVSATTSSSDRPAGAIKRYHLSDFRLPYIPEMEVQELPNSVCLDFVDGPGLQVACEDRAGQLNVLRVLREAYQKHTTFGQ